MLRRQAFPHRIGARREARATAFHCRPRGGTWRGRLSARAFFRIRRGSAGTLGVSRGGALRAALVGAVWSATVLPGWAASACALRADLTAHLEGKYRETQTGAGLQSGTRIVEIWASESGSWTIVVTDPRGVSCILASGSHWREIAPEAALLGQEG